jgi:DNA helicase II / ATP-dependent DNA helicase PcrA
MRATSTAWCPTRLHESRLVHEIYQRYMKACLNAGAMDFDDLLLNTNLLFRDFPEVLAKYQNSFRYILVDEYQDTNLSQYLIVRKLVEKHQNVCVVGDDAQSIYSFRGAKIENILNFRNDLPRLQNIQTRTKLPLHTNHCECCQ